MVELVTAALEEVTLPQVDELLETSVNLLSQMKKHGHELEPISKAKLNTVVASLSQYIQELGSVGAAYDNEDQSVEVDLLFDNDKVTPQLAKQLAAGINNSAPGTTILPRTM
ncbi:hypothetical protein LTR37_012530 [Vermiconidia calcicola]|uniref:Uncharacterized protein n=1 Tax=Vermiconidia calcicola TaxID=1690605 RepID=A0ACC3MZ26_9PEZI|nr:hypothetical protein LTR37_012530 [Vermiconidia calcicola]